jgi:hypothetical protein
MKEAIKEAGLKFVNRDSLIEGEERADRQHYIHGVPVGPNSDGVAIMVLQDAVDKAKSLKKITLLPVQDAMVVLRKTAAAMMNYITRCCTPYEAKAATEHFDEEVLYVVSDRACSALVPFPIQYPSPCCLHLCIRWEH